MYVNKEIYNLTVDDILIRIEDFLKKNDISFELAMSYEPNAMTYSNHFVKFYNYKNSCFGNLTISNENLTPDLNLYDKLQNNRGLTDGIYLNKHNLVELLQDILTINKLEYDANKIILEQENIKKINNGIVQEKILSTKKLDNENLKLLKNYLLTRGIKLNDNFLINYFKIIKTNQNIYIMMKSENGFTYDGYKLPNFEKAKLKGNSITFINNKKKNIVISEGKLDIFNMIMKKNDEYNYLINNGITHSKKLIEILKQHKSKLFLVDKDIRGIVFFIDTVKLLYPDLKNELDNILNSLNKKLLINLKLFTETEQFKDFYQQYKEIKKLPPLKKRKSTFYSLYEKISNNEYFDKYHTTKGFEIDIEDNKIFDTDNLIKFFEEIFNLSPKELLSDNIIETELNKILNITNDIKFYISKNEIKDYNELNYKPIKILNAIITNDNKILNKYKILPYSEELKKLKLNKELLELKEKDYYKYQEILLTLNNKIKFNANIKTQYQTDIKKINTINEIIEDKFIYGIDETNNGGSIGSIFISMVYANKERIKKYLKKQIFSNVFMKDYILSNLQLKKSFLIIEQNLDNDNISSLLGNVFKGLKNFTEYKEKLLPYYEYYLFSIITDSKKLNDEDMKNITILLEKLEKNHMVKIRTKIYKIDSNSTVKKIQKQGFKDLVNSLPVLTTQLKKQIEKILNETKNNNKKELLKEILLNPRKIIIDGEKIVDIVSSDKIVFEPKADEKYFQVSCASIIARTEQLKELDKIINKLQQFNNTELLPLITEIKNSKGYATKNHINTLKQIYFQLPENIQNYLKQIYRKNKSTNFLFEKIKKNDNLSIN